MSEEQKQENEQTREDVGASSGTGSKKRLLILIGVLVVTLCGYWAMQTKTAKNVLCYVIETETRDKNRCFYDSEAAIKSGYPAVRINFSQ